jgi:hypothetical protein
LLSDIAPSIQEHLVRSLFDGGEDTMEERFFNICRGCRSEAQVTREELEQHRRECYPYQVVERALTELSARPFPGCDPDPDAPDDPGPGDKRDGVKGALRWYPPETRGDPAALKAAGLLCAALGDWAWRPLRKDVAPIYYRQYKHQELPRLWNGPLEVAEVDTLAEQKTLEWVAGLHALGDPILAVPLFLDEVLRRIRRWRGPSTDDRALELSWFEVRIEDGLHISLAETMPQFRKRIGQARKDFIKKMKLRGLAGVSTDPLAPDQAGGVLHLSPAETAGKLRERAGKARKRYIEEMKNQGWKKVRQEPLEPDHFRWFVERTLFDMTLDQIIRSDPRPREKPMTPDGITHGVNTVASLLGIKPRSLVCPYCERKEARQREMKEHAEQCSERPDSRGHYWE